MASIPWGEGKKGKGRTVGELVDRCHELSEEAAEEAEKRRENFRKQVQEQDRADHVRVFEEREEEPW